MLMISYCIHFANIYYFDRTNKTTQMKSTTELKAYKKFGPGYFITEELRNRNLSKKDLSDLYGITDSELNGILENKRHISRETASLLAKAFDKSAEFWLNLDSSYRLWLKEKYNKYVL